MFASDTHIRALLQRGEAMLVEHGVPNARRNAEWMLCDALECSILDLYTREAPPPGDRVHRYWEHVERRMTREPLQRILGTTEFMSLPFEVHAGVFIPRPDTEVLVEAAERWLKARSLHEPLRVLDLGCGSGVIGVSLARRVPNVTLDAVDDTAEAVAATKRNARLNRVNERVRVWRCDAARFLDRRMDEAPDCFTAIACNPPYIESADLQSLPPEVRDYEPVAALDGGADGLDAYRALVPRLGRRLLPDGLAIFEIGDAQGGAVSGMLADEGFMEIEVITDLAGCDRVVAARRRREGEG
jgi:release factor glutamine methyltransferase